MTQGEKATKDAYREGFQDGRDGQDHRAQYPWSLVYAYLQGRDDARAFFAAGVSR